MDRIEELWNAAENGDTDRVKQLLAEGVNPNAANSMPWQITPLHVAAQNGHHETVSALLTAGADVNARSDTQRTPLHQAAQDGHQETASALLTAGADVNARDNKQITPLYLAAQNGHHETVSVLLTAGADVNAQDKWQKTPLCRAAENGHHETVTVLLTAGAEVDAQRNTLLNLGETNVHHETASILLTVGADLALEGNRESTSHNKVSESGQLELPLQGREDTGAGNEQNEMLEDVTAYTDDASSDFDSHNGNGKEEFTDKASRPQKEYDPVLVRFYEERGMTVAKTNCPLIQEAAKESGKTVNQVKNFIGNYRKSKGGSKRRPPPDTMERKRRITGYHEFHREQLPRKKANQGFSLAGANKEIGESWKNLTDEEKDIYNKAAERRRGKETEVKISSEVAKKLKQLEKLSEELGDLGVEAFMVTLYNGRIRAFGSQKGLAKDEKFGGYIENQLKAAEHQQKAAQCLTTDRRRRSSGREGSTGTTGESHGVTGRPGSSNSSVRKRRKKDKQAHQDNQQHPSSTASLPSASSTLGKQASLVRKRRKKDKEAQQDNQQHSSSTASLPSASSTQVQGTTVGLPQRTAQMSAAPNPGSSRPSPFTQGTITREELLPRTTETPRSTGTPVHVVSPYSTTSTPANTGNLEPLAQQSATLLYPLNSILVLDNTGTPVHVVSPYSTTSTPANTGNLELLAQQSATLLDPLNSIPASPHNTGTPVHVAPQATPTESQTFHPMPQRQGFRYLYSEGTHEFMAPQIIQPAFVHQAPTGVGNSFGLPDRTASLSLPRTSLTQGRTTVTTGGLPHTAPQIPTAASLGTSVPSQAVPTVRQAPTGVGTTNEQFPHSPLVFPMPYHR